MEGDDAAAPPRDVVAAVMKEGVKALMALPSGTVVCFVDANGPLATVRDGGNAKAPRWMLRPYVDLSAARTGGGVTSAQLPALPAESLFTIHRTGDRVTFRSLGAEGRTLQAVSGGEHQLVNYNLGPWESWAPHKEHGLVNAQWGTPLGMGLAVVHAALSADVKEASRRAARDLRQLHAAAHAAQQRSTEMERQVALAEAAARAEAGKGWQALQAKLSATDSQRAAASRTLAEQAAALEASERRREAAEADAAKAAKAAKAAAAKAAEAEARGREALRSLEDRLRAREAALAAAETEKKELFAALREAVQSAKAKDKDNAEKEAKHHHKADAAAAKERERRHKDKAAPAALAADAPATVESKPHAAPHVAASLEPLRAIPEAPAAAPPRPPPSAGKAARDRERQWPAPPPHPVWCASPATMPLSRMAHAQAAPPVPPIAESIAAQPVAPPPARTPPRAESLTALAAEAALLPCSEEEEGSFATASGAGSGSSGAGASGASAGAESAGSTQLSGGGAHVLPPLCRTPGSARKRLQMDSAATAVMASAGPAQAELVAASATRPARAERGREREREPTHHERERLDRDRTDRDRTERDRAERHHHRHEGERRHGERAEREPRPSAPAPPAAIAAAPKAAAASKPRPAAAAAKAGGRNGDASTLPPAPREPLGRRSVNDMFLGLWEPSLGGVTPSVPRRAAIEAQPRLAGWMPQRVAEENEY